jgi:uncharacterized membrane protein
MPENNSKNLKKPDSKLLTNKQTECEDIEERAVALLLQKYHLGPLPDPETLKEYNEILPDAAERILRMAEKSQEHHESIEKKFVNNDIKIMSRGQIFALVISLSSFIIATICAFLGQTEIGVAVVGPALAALVSRFLPGKRKKESKEKMQAEIDVLKKELANKDSLLKTTRAMNDMKSIGNAVESYITENYKAPQVTTMEGLKQQLEPNYIKELPQNDPWGKPYQYKPGDTDESEYTITCTGSENKIIYANGSFLD